MLKLLKNLWRKNAPAIRKDPPRNIRFTPKFEELETRLAPAGNVLILSTSIVGGAGSTEATEVTARGFTPVIKTAAEINAMTAADFATFKAIIIGDPHCGDPGEDAIIPSVANWRALVQG